MLFDEPVSFRRGDLGLAGPLGVMGCSVGGYGALRAAELHPERLFAVCAVSAALWRSHVDGVGDAFDSAADYARNDVHADVERLRGLPVRMDCGRQDPLHEAYVAVAEALPEPPAEGLTPGGRNDACWLRVAPAQIDWIGARLAPAAPAPSPGATFGA
jgi:pimeloyl-ACP methyl ester carboxylesterase